MVVWLICKIVMIAEVDSSFPYDGYGVGRIQRAAFEESSKNLALACLHIGAAHAASAVVCPLGHHHPSLGIEFYSVGHATGRPVHRSLPRLRIELHDVAGLHS